VRLALAWLVPCLALAACNDRSNVEAAPIAIAAPTPAPHQDPGKPPPPVQHDTQMYTTYFYTASEAVIHGYEDNTSVRIVSLADPLTKRKAGTIWEGKIGIAQAKTITTGPGVFGLLSDKKAAILVGTPSSCAVVGYFVKDQEGRFRSNRFFTQLPSTIYAGGERVVVWAYEPADVTIRATKTQTKLAEKSLEAGGRLELDSKQLASLGNGMLEIASTKSAVAVEVYYDEGFIVPSVTGSGTGTDFYTFVGAITQGTNDLDLVGLDDAAHATVTDVDSGKTLFDGAVKAHGIHTVNLANRYVRVHSDKSIQLAVAAFEHDGSGYAEQHFATGREGGGIDNDFEVTTSGQLWLFSYYDHNAITITDSHGKQVFAENLDAGNGHELSPGMGLYRVHSSKGMSVMGGASTCGADYSPAAGMFAVDEAMLQVIAQVTQERIETAHSRGITLTPEAAAAAPITEEEWQKHGAAAKAKSYSSMSLDEANQRADKLKK
jgi:hypothetical protein